MNENRLEARKPTPIDDDVELGFAALGCRIVSARRMLKLIRAGGSIRGL